MPPYLPGEITDYIIGLVWPNKHGLCSCSLVCKDWLPASRHHLFLNISTSPTSYDKLVKQLNQSSSMRVHLSSVRAFNFEGPMEGDFPLADFFKGQRFIHDFSGHLPSLRRVEFSRTFFGIKMHPGLHLALCNFRTLQELSLFDCVFDSFNSLRRMLIALPALTSLTMRFLAWVSISSLTLLIRPPAQARPSLKYLSLALKPDCIPDPDSLIDWLISLITPSRILLFMMGLKTEEDVDPLYLGPLRFMACLSSPSLVRDLMISPFEVEDHCFDLSLLINLENLELCLTDYTSPLAVRWDVLCRMLEDVRSRLRRLRISAFNVQMPESTTLTVGELDPTLFDGMEALDAVLEGKVFRHLEVVVFIAINQYLFSLDHAPFDDGSLCSEEPFREVIRVKLPKLYARGITKFAF